MKTNQNALRIWDELGSLRLLWDVSSSACKAKATSKYFNLGVPVLCLEVLKCEYPVQYEPSKFGGRPDIGMASREAYAIGSMVKGDGVAGQKVRHASHPEDFFVCALILWIYPPTQDSNHQDDITFVVGNRFASSFNLATGARGVDPHVSYLTSMTCSATPPPHWKCARITGSDELIEFITTIGSVGLVYIYIYIFTCMCLFFNGKSKQYNMNV